MNGQEFAEKDFQKLKGRKAEKLYAEWVNKAENVDSWTVSPAKHKVECMKELKRQKDKY